MLKILKLNPILLTALSIIMCLGIWGWVFITGYNTYKINMPFFNTLWGWAVDIKTFSVGIGIIIIMAHAFIWNAFINRNNILKQSSNFPAFFFVLLASCKSSLVGFYPSLLASFFLMLAIRRLAAGYKKKKPYQKFLMPEYLLALPHFFTCLLQFLFFFCG